jgi:hypothetical protein
VHVTEGLDLGPAELAVRKELAAKAPLAYLAAVWKSLSPEARAALEAAWQLEMEGAPLRVTRRRRSQGALRISQGGDGGSQ